MMERMLDVHDLQAGGLRGLSPEALALVAEQMLLRIDEQSREIASQAQAIRWRDAKIERLTFELARLKAWKFAARTERMSARAAKPNFGHQQNVSPRRA